MADRAPPDRSCNRAFLVAVERFDRRVDVNDVTLAQQGMRALIDMLLLPFKPCHLGHSLQCAANKSSLAILLIPSSSGSTLSYRSAVMWA